MKAINPILTGFNPDPSIIHVNGNYYIATSTFEWFPGVQIHHSKDLVNWRLLNHALTRKSQLDMVGNPDSCGVWAPCLTYHSGVYYLIYSNVRSFDGGWKDTPNFLVTCSDIEKGDWSEPIYLNSCGFDASLFHDADGRKWYSSMIVDHRGGKFFGGIILQEYDTVQQKLVGPRKNIFSGTALGITEAPHIYYRNGYYYLITAEGGTEYNHAVSMARSKDIWGPYEVHPQNPIISSRYNADAYLQKAGHASIIEANNGKWYAAFLVGRPLTKLGRCTLGRETALAEMEWSSDDWLYQVAGSCEPLMELDITGHQEMKWPENLAFDHFDAPVLSPHYNALRIPITVDWCTLNERKSHLRLYGRESLNSFHYQSLLARRVQHFNFEASTIVELASESFQQMAGLVCYYNTVHYHYLHLSFHEEVNKKMLQIISCDKGNNSEPLFEPVDITGYVRIGLKVVVNRADLQFYYSLDEIEWLKIGPILDFSILSDDYIQNDKGKYRPAFTGAFVGINCIDLTGAHIPADFDWFKYEGY
ncbi:MAG: glycoside hydrolase family 43 protein [Prolixibacteraceae bacterium]